MTLSDTQLKRYRRHLILDQIGDQGQEKLLKSKVLIIGLGGLGSPITLYLAAAGVGTLGLADGDVVDISNLQRQVIHFTSDIHELKVVSARNKVTQLNPDVKVVPYQTRVTADTVSDLIADYDFIIEATDNFEAKFLINDACVRSRKPYSHGGILRFEGQTLTVLPGHACYRCIFNAPPVPGDVPTGPHVGVLGAVPGVIGAIQAAEAIKFLLGQGELLTNRLLCFDALTMNFRSIPVNQDPRCPICSKK